LTRRISGSWLVSLRLAKNVSVAVGMMIISSACGGRRAPAGARGSAAGGRTTGFSPAHARR
jgi:hypothetical protein